MGLLKTKGSVEGWGRGGVAPGGMWGRGEGSLPVGRNPLPTGAVGYARWPYNRRITRLKRGRQQ